MYDYYDLTIENHIIQVGSTYLLNLENELTIQPTDYFKTTISKENLYFFGIYPINCKINVHYFENGDRNKTQNLNEKNVFYQDIISPEIIEIILYLLEALLILAYAICLYMNLIIYMEYP